MHDRRQTDRPATRRAELRDRILAALAATGGIRGPVRPRQRALSRAVEAIDCGEPAAAARLVLGELGVR